MVSSLEIRRWVLLLSAVFFMANALAHGYVPIRSAIGSSFPDSKSAPLDPVITANAFPPILLSVVSLKKSLNYFHLMHPLADHRVAHDRYISVNPMYVPGILKPGHHQQALLHLDLPPPTCS